MIAHPQKGSSKSGHFTAQFHIDLLEDRHNAADKYHNDGSHHGDHNKRIGHSIPDAVGDGLFFLIVIRQGKHTYVQITGFFSQCDHVETVIRENICRLQCFVEAFSLSADGEDLVKDRFSLRGSCIAL